MKLVAKMKCSRQSIPRKAESYPGESQSRWKELRSMKLKEAAKNVENGIEKMLTYCDFPGEHWTHIRTNNVIERLNRDNICLRAHVVDSFPDGNSAFILVCAMLLAPSGVTSVT